MASSPSDALALPASLLQSLTWASRRLAALQIEPAEGAPASTTAASEAGAPIPGAPLLCVRALPGCGYGLVASVDIAPETVLLRASPAWQIRSSASAVADLLPKDDAWLALVLSLLYELSLGARSTLADYLASLPRQLHQPMFWSSEQRARLRGCSFADRVDYFDLRQDYETKVRPFVQQHAKRGFSSQVCTYDTFCLVTGWILSRAFRPRGTGTSGDPVLVPMIDLCNTTSLRLDADVSGSGFEQKINADAEWVATGSNTRDSPTLLIRSLPGCTIARGQQVYIPYGTLGLSSASLLTRYGFVEGAYPKTENTYDEVSISPGQIVDLFHGRESPAQDASKPSAASVNGGPAKEGSAAARQDVEGEDAEAKAVHEEARKKNAATAAAAPGAQEKKKHSGENKMGDEDDGDDASSDGSASGDSDYAAHMDFINSLPFDRFVLPSSGAIPLRMQQLLGVLLGEVSLDVFGNLCERDAWEQRREQKEKEAKERAFLLASAHGTNKEATKTAPAAAASSTPSHLLSPEASPSPPPLAGLRMDYPSYAGADEDEDEEEPPFTLEMVRAIDARQTATLEKSPDVWSQAFLVLHHALSRYTQTLEEDVTELAGLEQVRDQLQKLQRDAAGAPAVFDSAQPADPSAVDATRRELALRVRASEKRILYRALELTKARVASLADQMDLDASGDEEEAGSADEESEIARVQRALREAGETAEGDAIDMGDAHADPNIVDPSLIAMLTNQRKRKDDQPTTATPATDDAGEEVEPVEETILTPTPTEMRFTYTKSTKKGDQAKKKRRG